MQLSPAVKKLFLRGFIFIAISFAAFHIYFGIILPHLVLSSNDTYINRWYKFYTEPVDAEIVAIGSSTTLRGYNAHVIKKETGMKPEIIGMMGMRLSNYNGFLNDYLRINQPPKVLLINIDLMSLNFREILPFHHYFVPAIPTDSYLYQQYNMQWEAGYRAFGYFYYRSEYYKAISFPQEQPHEYGFMYNKAYWKGRVIDPNLNPGDLIMEEGAAENQLAENKEETPKNNTFRCNCENVVRDITLIGETAEKFQIPNVFLVAIPMYSNARFTTNRDDILHFLDSAATAHNMRLINFNGGYAPGNDTTNYYNSLHLNLHGSRVFASDLCDSLQVYLP